MRFISIIILTLIVIHGGARAADLQTVYRQALAADPLWLEAQASNRAAQESTKQSFSAFLPAVDLSANSVNNFRNSNSLNPIVDDRRQSFNSNTWNLNVAQPVFRMTNYATHRQAKAGVRQADVQLTLQAQDLILRVAEAYFNVLSAETELASVKAEKKAIAQQLEQTQKRFEVGVVAKTDVHEAQASYDLVLADELAAENQRLLAGIALSEITGEHYQQLNSLKQQFELVAPQPDDIDEWVKRALEHNLSLAVATVAVEVARENVNVRRAGHYPTLDLVATAGNNTSHDGNFGSDTDSNTLGLYLNVPLYAGGAVNSRTRQALAQLEQARQRLTQSRRATEKLTRDAYLGILSAISRIRALQQAVVSAQSAVDATEAGYDVGTRTIVDVLNAQRLLYRATSDLQKARYAYLLNDLRLKQAVGSLSDADLAGVNQLLTAN